ncbi:UNVERIFIED_CONTAM: Pectinesterase inhibitor 3 [Sesamum latifolium]|uniref:Pectinesterase inhibitor 3 n=1 Tax=Sesamum latifolium TaxID=2727402 RepID=A0AAW2U0P0_9LAMI
MIRTLHSCLLILLLSPTLLISTTHAAEAPKHDLVRRSCVHASYPEICLRTLSSYGGAASTPRDLAQAAVRVSLAHVRRASEFLSQLKVRGKREQGALSDCVDQMGDSVEELSKTLAALEHLRRGADFRWQMSNAETWVSAALTNEDTCLDGFKEIDGKVRSDVRRKITNVARVTSNALYLINLLDDQSRGKP